MPKQAVVKDGKVLVVDTEKGTYERATPKSDGFVSGLITGFFEGGLAVISAPITIPMDALTGSNKKK